MKRAGIIINPNAKKIRTGKTSVEKYQNVKSENIVMRISNGLDEIQDISKDFQKEGIDYIAIAGGDGTIHLTLTEIIKAYGEKSIPPILILKEGTMDNIARSIKLRGTGLSLIKKLRNKLEQGVDLEVHNRRTIKIDGKYCFIFGTGFITNFLNEVYSRKEKGTIRNIQVGFHTMKEAISNNRKGKIFNFLNEDVTIDGKKLGFDSINGILAGTVEHVGMSFSPLKEAGKNDSAFQVIITGMSPRKMLLNVNKLRRGKKINSKDYINVFAKELNIKTDGEFDYTMDGDIYKAVNNLKVELGPEIELIKL